MAGIFNDATEAYDSLKEFLPSCEFDFKKAGFHEGKVNYNIVDEERKININKASPDILKRFLELAADVSSRQAAEISASIIDWRKAQDTQNKDVKSLYYQDLNLQYPYKKKNFEVLEELLLVEAMTRDIFNKIKSRVTVYGSGEVNINTADKLVLESLGISSDLAEKIIHFRIGTDGKEATSDDNIFLATENIVNTLYNAEHLSRQEQNQLVNAVTSGLLCVRSNYFSGTSTGKNNNDYYSIDFVFNRDKNINFWREE
jgi:type II secretory pathway component PulK